MNKIIFSRVVLASEHLFISLCDFCSITLMNLFYLTNVWMVYQLIVASLLYDPPFVHDHYLVSQVHVVNSMSD